MQIVSPLVEDYAARYTTFQNDLLYEVHESTMQAHPHAHMLSGHVQGRFLALISNLVRPSMILEVGSFTGYSALCLAEGLVNGGELHTIELRETDAATAIENFSKCQWAQQIHLHCGNAKDIIPTLDKKWDLVFIDADKTAYIDYYEMILPQVNAGGIIIADNVLFHGQVLATPLAGKNAKAIDAFNKHVAQDTRVEQILLTLRDGLLLIKKL